MWEAWSLAKTFQKRPSEIFSFHDEIVAWCFDRAVYLFGSSIEEELAAAAAGASNEFQRTTRTQAVFRRWLGIEPKFRDPLAAGQVKNSSTEAPSDDGIVNL